MLTPIHFPMPPPKYSSHFQTFPKKCFLFKRKHANSVSQHTAARSAARHRRHYWKKMAEAAGEDALSAAINGATDRDPPRPYLKDMFEFTEVKGDSYRLKCLLCLPRVNEISAFKNSPSNLRKHIEVS